MSVLFTQTLGTTVAKLIWKKTMGIMILADCNESFFFVCLFTYTTYINNKFVFLHYKFLVYTM